MRVLNLRVLTVAGACAITIGVAGCGGDDDTDTPDEGNDTSQSTTDEDGTDAVAEEMDPLAALAGEWEESRDEDPDEPGAGYGLGHLTIHADGSVDMSIGDGCSQFSGMLELGDSGSHSLDLEPTEEMLDTCEPVDGALTFDESSDVLTVELPWLSEGKPFARMS